MADIDPTQWGALITATLIGTAAIVGAFARPLFEHIFRARKLPCSMSETALLQIDELHEWHGPDHMGEQGWRGHGMERRIEQLEASAVTGLKSLRDGQSEVADLLRTLIELQKRGSGSL